MERARDRHWCAMALLLRCMLVRQLRRLWLTAVRNRLVSLAFHFCLSSLSADNDVVPDGAKSFVKALQRSIRAGGAKGEAAGGKSRGDLATLYDSEFPKLTERYFKASSWPAADAIGQFIEDGQNTETGAMRSSILSLSFFQLIVLRNACLDLRLGGAGAAGKP